MAKTMLPIMQSIGTYYDQFVDSTTNSLRNSRKRPHMRRRSDSTFDVIQRNNIDGSCMLNDEDDYDLLNAPFQRSQFPNQFNTVPLKADALEMIIASYPLLNGEKINYVVNCKVTCLESFQQVKRNDSLCVEQDADDIVGLISDLDILKHKKYPGYCFISNFCISVHAANGSLIRIPLHSIYRVDKSKDRLLVITKYLRIYTLEFTPANVQTVNNFLYNLQIAKQSLSSPYFEDYFAYCHSINCTLSNMEWYLCENVFSLEFKRFGLENKDEWCINEINKKFELSSTYPQQLILPSALSPLLLTKAATFRSLQRIPTITYISVARDKPRGCLIRSSQPMVGVLGSRCDEDEEILRQISRNMQLLNASFGNQSKMCIFDARPYKNAIVNGARGGGYENSENYQAELMFLNIPNIHVVRSSYDNLMTIFEQCNSHYQLNNCPEVQKWLCLIGQLILAAHNVAEKIKNGFTCLLHCSDSWDRTSQISSLAQIIIDPYYRTAKGLQVLLEKDWIKFGHRFAQRTGTPFPHSSSANPINVYESKRNGDTSASEEIPSIGSQEYSPIFLQFMDCLHQIISQYPSEFQYTSAYLVKIVQLIYSGQFGNFIGNCEFDRMPIRGKKLCFRDLWCYLDDCLQEELVLHKRKLLNTRFQLILEQCHPLKVMEQSFDSHFQCCFNGLINPAFRKDEASDNFLKINLNNLQLWKDMFLVQDNQCKETSKSLNVFREFHNKAMEESVIISNLTHRRKFLFRLLIDDVLKSKGRVESGPGNICDAEVEETSSEIIPVIETTDDAIISYRKEDSFDPVPISENDVMLLKLSSSLSRGFFNAWKLYGQKMKQQREDLFQVFVKRQRRAILPKPLKFWRNKLTNSLQQKWKERNRRFSLDADSSVFPSNEFDSGQDNDDKDFFELTHAPGGEIANELPSIQIMGVNVSKIFNYAGIAGSAGIDNASTVVGMGKKLLYRYGATVGRLHEERRKRENGHVIRAETETEYLEELESKINLPLLHETLLERSFLEFDETSFNATFETF